MSSALETLGSQLELADELLAGRGHMFEPQDLPGRYGHVVKAIDHLLDVIGAQAALGGGWAAWRHGYVGRVTQDIDVLLSRSEIEPFLQAAGVSGFEVLRREPGRWPKLVHPETGITVDILPEGERPGTPSRPAPTTLPHPSAAGASGQKLRYVTLPVLIELKLAAGRPRDEGDVAELIRANPSAIEGIRRHLASVHAEYLAAFNRLVQRAGEQQDR